jgi:hypothetical protein
MTKLPKNLARALLDVEDESHYAALGRFITAFANTEGMVHELTRKFSGLSDEKARITFGGMRLSDVVDRLRQYIVIDSVPKETSAEIDYCLTQLVHIAERRHKLVHRGVIFRDGAFVISNVMTTRSLKNIEVESLDEELLENMLLDCGSIYMRLLSITHPERILEASKKTLAMMRALAWRYKHEPPKSQNRRLRKDRELRKRQPPSSQE